MGLTTTASDWEVAGICQLGGAAGLGGGAFMFMFRSAAANVNEAAFFFGGGIGLGGSAGGAGAPDLSEGGMSYSPLECAEPFSLRGLHNSGGRLTTLGASFIVGAGFTYISAFTTRGELFTSQGGFGLSLGGAGFGGMTTVGRWEVGRLAVRTSDSEERELRRSVEGSRSR